MGVPFLQKSETKEVLKYVNKTFKKMEFLTVVPYIGGLWRWFGVQIRLT